jgi:hypothetical protein
MTRPIHTDPLTSLRPAHVTLCVQAAIVVVALVLIALVTRGWL